MPATVTLATATLTFSVDAGSTSITVSSTSGMFPGVRLYVDRELMAVINLGVGTLVNVRRGQDGTLATPHSSSAVITIGSADQFYFNNPMGAPASATPVSPYINVRNGTIWYAQGDTSDPDGSSFRWWQNVTTTYSQGALGVRYSEQDPTSST